MPAALRCEPSSGRYLSFAKREEIALLSAQAVGVREIASRIARAVSTVSRELRRNAATRGGQLEYRASVAQWKAEPAARRPKSAKLVTNDLSWNSAARNIRYWSKIRMRRDEGGAKNSFQNDGQLPEADEGAGELE